MSTTTEVEELLASALVADSVVVEAAEARLKVVTGSVSGCGALLQVLQTSQVPAVRQMAATLLRRHLPKLWTEVPPEEKRTVKTALVALTTRETEDRVRDSVLTMMAAIEEVEGWPELREHALLMVEASQPEPIRCSGFALVTALLEGNGLDTFPLQALLGHIGSAIAPGVGMSVRISALDTYGTLLLTCRQTDDVVGTIPQAVDAARDLFVSQPDGASDDDLAQAACKLFEILSWVIIEWTPKVAEVFPLMLTFGLQEALRQGPGPNGSGGAPAFVSAARAGATEFVATSVTQRPKAVRRAKMVNQCVEAAFRLMCESESDTVQGWEDADNDDDEEDLESSTTALVLGIRLLDAAASRLPPKDVFSRGMTCVQELAVSPFATVRAVAYRSIAVMAEGCRNEFSQQCREIMNALSTAFRTDPDVQVRASAVRSIGALVESLEVDDLPEEVIAQVRDMAMAAAVEGIRDADMRVRKLSCATLEASLTLYEDEEDIAPHLDTITEALSQAGITEQAVSAAAALAEAAGESFTRCKAFSGIVQAIVQLMDREDEKDLTARAVATASAASITSALGAGQREARDEFVGHIANRALRGYALDSPELREHTHVLFTRLADSLSADVVIEAALASLNQDDGIFLDKEGNDMGAEDDDDDDDAEPYAFSVRTALLDEKAAAMDVIGAIAMVAKTDQFRPQNPEPIREGFKAALETVDQYRGYFHESIRAAAVRLSARIAVATKSPVLGAQDALRKAAAESAFTSAIDFIKNDDDTEVVAAGLEAVCIIAWGLGPDIVEPFRAEVTAAIRSVLDGTALCRVDEEKEEPGYQPDDEERRDGLVDSLSEAIVSLCYAFRALYTEEFLGMLPLILSGFCTPQNPPADCTAAVGAIAESMNHLHFVGAERLASYVSAEQREALNTAAADASVGELLPLCVRALGEMDHAQLRRNAVFLTGVLFLRSSAARGPWSELTAVAGQVIALLRGGGESDPSVLDNAAGCLGRIIAAPAFPYNVPIFPDMVDAMLLAVPLTADPNETWSIARAVLCVAKRGDDGWRLLQRQPGKVVEVMARALLMYDDPDRVKVVDGVTELNDQEILEARQLFVELQRRLGIEHFTAMNLPDDDKRKLEALLS